MLVIAIYIMGGAGFVLGEIDQLTRVEETSTAVKQLTLS